MTHIDKKGRRVEDPVDPTPKLVNPHNCKEADCQINLDGTRRRNPLGEEPDAAPSIPKLKGKK